MYSRLVIVCKSQYVLASPKTIKYSSSTDETLPLFDKFCFTKVSILCLLVLLEEKLKLTVSKISVWWLVLIFAIKLVWRYYTDYPWFITFIINTLLLTTCRDWDVVFWLCWPGKLLIFYVHCCLSIGNIIHLLNMKYIYFYHYFIVFSGSV